MKGDKSTKVLLVILIAGLFLLLYPTVSNYWNQYHQTRAKAVYSHEVQEMDSKEYQQMLQEARAYNQRLMEKKDRYVPVSYTHLFGGNRCNKQGGFEKSR